MHPFRHALPAEQHDAEKARLEEEGGQHLVGHQRADDVAAAARQLAPIGAELVRQHHAGDHAHAERHGEDLGPVLGDVHVDRLAGLEPQRLEHHQPGGEPDGEGRKDDVERDGEGELDARQQKRVELGHPCRPHRSRAVRRLKPSATASLALGVPAQSAARPHRRRLDALRDRGQRRFVTLARLRAEAAEYHALDRGVVFKRGKHGAERDHARRGRAESRRRRSRWRDRRSRRGRAPRASASELR